MPTDHQHQKIKDRNNFNEIYSNSQTGEHIITKNKDNKVSLNQIKTTLSRILGLFSKPLLFSEFEGKQRHNRKTE